MTQITAQLNSNSITSSNYNRSTNLVKSAIYRWFQLFEQPLTKERVDLQLKLLSPEIHIETPLGQISAKEQFPQKIFIFEQWVNAVHFDEIYVHPCGVRVYTAYLNSSYEVQMIDGSKVNYVVNFEADVILNDDLTYQFKRIKIKKDQKYHVFQKDIYSFLRTSELVHYSFGLLERSSDNIQLYKNFFNPEFEINTLNSEKITTLPDLSSWLAKLNLKWKNLMLNPTNIEAVILPSSEIQVSFDLLMEGENMDGMKKISLSKNIWVVTNNPLEEYARVKSMKAEALDAIFI